MKHLLLVFLLIISNVATAQFVVQQSGTSQHLSSVYFSDDNTGYAVGDSGVILKTINGGGKWQILKSQFQHDINGVAFINASLGFIVGNENMIYRTIDGGAQWTEINTQVYAHYTAIQFVNELTGFIIGHSTEGGVLLVTQDRGLTWNTKIISINQKNNRNPANSLCDYIYFQNLSFLNSKTGLIGGYCYNHATGKHPFLCKTTDGGNTFQDYSISVEASGLFSGVEISSVNFITPHDAYIVKSISNRNGFIYTSDFRVKSFGPLANIDLNCADQYIYNSFFIDRFNGYILCLRDGKPTILKTIDLGESFINLYPPTENILRGVFFTNINNGYFVGDNGVILHLVDNNNVVYEYYNEDDTDPPFTFAMPLKKPSLTEIYVYNVSVDKKDKVSISFYDGDGGDIEVFRFSTKIYKNEIRIKVKTEDLIHGTYFFTVKLSEKAIINGKLNVDNYAHLY